MLIGARTAFVPVGISCQPAWQIEAHRTLLQGLCGERLARKGTPFDWRIAGLADIAGMIGEDEFWPGRAQELRLEKLADPPGSGAIASKLYWPRRRCLFWHERQLGHTLFGLKQAHLAENFARLEGVAHRLFFASNLQNNLAPLESHHLFDGTIRRSEAVALWQALNRRFGPSVLHVLTRPALAHDFAELDGTGPDVPLSVQLPGLPVFLHCPGRDMAPDWKGDAGFWRRVLQRAWEENGQ